MIALDRDMPMNCYECPCLETLRFAPEKDLDIKVLFRQCKAVDRIIVGPISSQKGVALPLEWMKWDIPKWCPWEELDDCVD